MAETRLFRCSLKVSGNEVPSFRDGFLILDFGVHALNSEHAVQRVATIIDDGAIAKYSPEAQKTLDKTGLSVVKISCSN